MASVKLGKIEKVNLREVWQNEATQFTPWLESNLWALNEALGMDLEIQRREAPVGSFSLDLLAKDLSTNRTVVIENQLTESDHRHFGQLLLYASGYDADVVIWLAEEIRPEHRQALDWLNQRTDEGTEFFGVVIELLKIDNSSPAPNFKLIAFPNEWRKDKIGPGGDPGTGTVRSDAYRNYFQLLIDELREDHKFTASRKGQPTNWADFTSGISGLSYGTSFALNNQVRVNLYIDREEKEGNKQIFDRLKKNQDDIEQEFPGEQVVWERLDDNRASRIALYRQGNILNDEETLKEIRNWAISRLLKFKAVFGPQLPKVIE